MSSLLSWHSPETAASGTYEHLCVHREAVRHIHAGKDSVGFLNYYCSSGFGWQVLT